MGEGTGWAPIWATVPRSWRITWPPTRPGAIPVPLNFRLSPREITWILNHAKAKALIFGETFLPTVKQIRSDLETVEHFIVVGNDPADDVKVYEDLIESHPSHHPGVSIGPDDFAILMYTAGTTGFPKGVLTSHANEVWNIMNVKAHDAALGISANRDTMAFPLPFFHKAAYISCVGQLINFGRAVIMPSFDPVGMLEIIQEERVNLFTMVPAVANAILQVPGIERYDVTSLNTVKCTGAPLPTAIKERFMSMFPDLYLYDHYGMTEVPTISVHVTHGKADGTMTVGQAYPFTEIKILDKAGLEPPSGQVGEICLRSPSLLCEYFENPDATAAAFQGGWFHTGDMGVLDREGNLSIKDRKHDMIISGGENIYPAEIEQVLFGHPPYTRGLLCRYPGPYI